MRIQNISIPVHPDKRILLFFKFLKLSFFLCLLLQKKLFCFLQFPLFQKFPVYFILPGKKTILFFRFFFCLLKQIFQPIGFLKQYFSFPDLRTDRRKAFFGTLHDRCKTQRNNCRLIQRTDQQCKQLMMQAVYLLIIIIIIIKL